MSNINTALNNKQDKEREKQRVELIREGNAAFNEGNIDMAARIFKATDYKDGLIRVGDYYYFDKHQPLMAYGYYRRANYQKMLDKIFDGFTFALKCWLWDEENSDRQEQSQTEKVQPSESPNLENEKKRKQIPGVP